MEESDKVKYKSLYIQTARAYVRDMQTNLSILLTGAENPDAISVVHLAAHSLASQSLLMGYATTGSASFAIEKIFKARMEGHLSFKVSTLQMIDSIVNKISLSLDEIEKTGHELDLTDESKELETILRL
jgi:chemotaxis protein histidine kinase CheA